MRPASGARLVAELAAELTLLVGGGAIHETLNRASIGRSIGNSLYNGFCSFERILRLLDFQESDGRFKSGVLVGARSWLGFVWPDYLVAPFTAVLDGRWGEQRQSCKRGVFSVWVQEPYTPPFYCEWECSITYPIIYIALPLVVQWHAFSFSVDSFKPVSQPKRLLIFSDPADRLVTEPTGTRLPMGGAHAPGPLGRGRRGQNGAGGAGAAHSSCGGSGHVPKRGRRAPQMGGFFFSRVQPSVISQG